MRQGEFLCGCESLETMDAELLGALIDRHASALELFARQWCESAEDVVQEAFVKLACQNPQPENPLAWLFRVVRHKAMNAGIASRRRKRHETEAGAQIAWWFQPDDSVEIDPDQAQSALACLPIEQREVIVAHLWGGLTFQEIAAMVDSSGSTIHRRYQAGLVTLREQLGVACPAKSARTKPE